MLWRALAGVERGLYIDIGAQDPIVDSVSLAFHERGWRGVHLEPTPHYAELLRQQRPRDTIIQAAVGNEQAAIRFFEIPGTGISTADVSIAAQHRERGFDVREIAVPCIPLSSVFDTVGDAEVHWLKIDVEGLEAQVLSSWGASTVRPWIVVVESILPLSRIETHEKWEAQLLSYGYSLTYFDGVNRFYVSDSHPELKSAFQIPPNIFDRFALNGTASATFHKRIEDRCNEKVSAALAQVEQVKSATSREIELLTADLASAGKAHAESERKLIQREQAVNQQLLAEQGEVRSLLGEAVKRERVLSEQTGMARQQLETMLRTSAQREQEFAAQLLAAHEQALAEKAEHASRVEDLLKNLAMREREIDAQLLATEQKALREMAEQAGEHEMQVRLLERRQAERERALRDRLDSVRADLHCLQKEQSQREREHVQEIRQSRQQLETELRRQLNREKEAIAQLLHFQQDAVRDKAEQANRHNEEVELLQREHLQQVEAHNQQLQAAQQSIQDGISNFANVKRQFDEQLNAELEASRQLRDAMASLEIELAAMRNAISWRITAPLRAVAQWFGKPSDSGADSKREAAHEQIVEFASSVSTSLSEASPQADTLSNSNREASSMKSDHLTVTTPLLRSNAYESFKALLQCQDYQFVESAYLTLLKRKPDSEGGSYYLGRLRAGVPKIQILGQLCASEEARMMGVQLPGLRRALKWQKLAQMPVLGSFVRIFASVERNTQFENRLRSVEQQIFVLGQQSELRFSQLDRSMDEIKKAIEAGMRASLPTQVQHLPSAVVSQVEAVAEVRPQARSILTEAIVLKSGTPDDVIGQLAFALANSQEAQQLAERC
jgi:FkbM family methyltransferase